MQRRAGEEEHPKDADLHRRPDARAASAARVKERIPAQRAPGLY